MVGKFSWVRGESGNGLVELSIQLLGEVEFGRFALSPALSPALSLALSRGRGRRLDWFAEWGFGLGIQVLVGPLRLTHPTGGYRGLPGMGWCGLL